MLDVVIKRPREGSPLRYPGGKASLSGYFASVIDALDLSDPTYVEPYAGGAGAAISLLTSNKVSRVVINDLDPAIAAFWSSVVSRNTAFLDLLSETEVTLAEWRKQREVYQRRDLQDPLTLGFATFFLNRTNRSGVLHAGVIGGQEQSGTYKIDARYNKVELARKIELIGLHSSQIVVSSIDGRQVVEKYSSDDSALIYVDPPYVEMGGSLYMNAFTRNDHALLAACLNRNRDANWILTYDNADIIRTLYSERVQMEFDLLYSAHKREIATELMILSDSVGELVRPE